MICMDCKVIGAGGGGGGGGGVLGGVRLMQSRVSGPRIEAVAGREKIIKV